MSDGANILLYIVIGVAVAWLLRRVLKRQRVDRLRATPLPLHLKDIAQTNLPFYRRLPIDMRGRLDGLINQFLADVNFVGCDGQEIDDEVRVTIAAQACLLIVNKPERWFDGLRTIYVYPEAFKGQHTTSDGTVHHENTQTRSGESWQYGPVVLSWSHARFGALVPDDGRNVILHEFAHQLDSQTGVTDGAPLLSTDHHAGDWAHTLGGSYEKLRQLARKGHPHVLDDYGATAPAEFFAVAAEVFFEQPAKLRAAEPALYEQLTKYFNLDPENWG